MLQKKKTSRDIPRSLLCTSNSGIVGEPVVKEEDDLEQKIMNNMLTNPVEQTSLGIQPSVNASPLINKKKKKSRRGLVQTQFIKVRKKERNKIKFIVSYMMNLMQFIFKLQPRTEQDKLYGMQEMKRYKEIKEKLRREKKRRAMKNLPALLLDEEDDSLADTSLNDSTVDVDDSLINNKFITSSIDELDMWKNQSAKRIDNKNTKKTNKKPETSANVLIEKRFRKW